MAGHSKWANIKHRKASVDANRSKLWSKLSKAIIVAAKLGGGDPGANSRLRTAIIDAKAVSMPRDNIERAIKKGTGELDGGNVEEILYEGYGPGGVAVLCDIMTDNRNRTASEVRKIFDTCNGKLGSTNCVAYLFERKGLISLNRQGINVEQVMEVAIEAGADDISEVDERLEISCSTEVYSEVVENIEATGSVIDTKEVARVPSATVDVDDDTAKLIIKLIMQLEDHDDIQSVATNVNFTAAQVEAE